MDRFVTTMTALLVMAAPARADRIGVVGVDGAGGPVPAREVTSALEAALGESSVVNAVAVAGRRLTAGAVRVERLEIFARVQQLISEGWRSYLEARPTFAAARLGESRTVALEVADLPGGAQLIAEVSLRLGVVKLDLGRAAEAADDFRLARALDPDRVVDDSEFKPEVVTAYQAAIAAEPDRTPRTVSSGQGGARVWIDGRDAGLAPAEVELGDGVHLVVARAPGHRAAARLVSASRGNEAEISMSLDPDPRRRALASRPLVSVGMSEAAVTTALEALSLYGELDAVLMAAVVWRRGQPALLGQLCASAPLRCNRVIEVGFARRDRLRAAAAELVARARDAPRRLPPSLSVDARITSGEGPPGSDPPIVVDDDPWWKSGWLWAGVGAAALTGAATVVLTRDRDIEAVIVGDPCAFGGCARR